MSKVKPILPCARCHDPAGSPRHGATRPARTDARPYGIDGDVCQRCYRMIYDEHRRQQNHEKYGTPRPVAVRACDSCGDPGGRARHTSDPGAKPARFVVVADSGEELRVCHSCRFSREDSPARRAFLVPELTKDPRPREIVRLARETLRDELGGVAVYIEPRYQGPADPAVAEAERVRAAARRAIEEGRAAERARKGWKITLPEARA